MSNEMFLVGIDYGINSPAMSVWSGNIEDDFKIEKVQVLSYIDTKKKKFQNLKNILTLRYPTDYKSEIQRYSLISDPFIININSTYIQRRYVALEGYSFGVVGNYSYKNGENTGILKYKMFEEEIPLRIYPPTVMKKIITGKGNAKKDSMLENFNNKFNMNVEEYYGIKWRNSPLPDIIDSISVLYSLYLEMRIRENMIDNITKDELNVFTKKNKDSESFINRDFII